MLNDDHFSGSPADIDFSRVFVRTLVVSAEDDRFGTAETARGIVGAVLGAELVVYPTGGHIWLGHDDDDLADRIAGFVLRQGW